jgi:hypothetical protein
LAYGQNNKGFSTYTIVQRFTNWLIHVGRG